MGTGFREKERQTDPSTLDLDDSSPPVQSRAGKPLPPFVTSAGLEGATENNNDSIQDLDNSIVSPQRDDVGTTKKNRGQMHVYQTMIQQKNIQHVCIQNYQPM